jgi:hypothetical protein
MVRRVDAQPGQAQLGCGQLLERLEGGALEHDEVARVAVDHRLWWQIHVDELEDFLRRLPVGDVLLTGGWAGG